MEKWQSVLVISLVIAFLIISPLILGGRVPTGDSLDYFLPQLTFYKNAIQEGASPFWNPYSGSGFPMGGSAFQWFNPLVQIAIRIFSPIIAFNLLLFLFLFLALFFAIQFLRDLKLSYPAALFGGLSYLIAEIQLSNNPAFSVNLLFLPAIFWLILKVGSISKTRDLILLGLLGVFLVSLSWFSGIYWSTFYVLIAAFAFAAALSWKQTRRPLIFFLAVFFISTAVASVQLVPAYIMTQFSARADGLSYVDASVGAIMGRDLLDFFFPLPLSAVESRSYLYIGLIPFVFLIVSFFIRRQPFIWFFRLLFFIPFFMGIDKSPLFWLINKLPVFNYFRIPVYFMFVGAFGAIVLAAMAADKILPKLRQLKSFLPGAIIVFLLIDLLIVYFNFFRFLPRALVEKKPEIAAFSASNPGKIFALFPEDAYTEFYFAAKLAPPPNPRENPEGFNVWKETLYPNYNQLYNIESPEIYDPLANFYMSRYLALLGSRNIISQVDPAEKLAQVNLELVDKIAIFKERRPLANFLGIRYFLSALDLHRYDSEFKKDTRIAAELGLAVAASSTPMGFGIYENKSALPLFYFASVDEFVDSPSAAFDRFRQAGFRGLFVECGHCQPEAGGSGKIIIDNRYFDIRQRDKIKFNTETDGKRFLVFSQSYYPGWKAFIDGKEVPIYTVNAVFIGIFIPEGRHEVIFEYRYRHLWESFLKSFLS